MTGFFKKKVRFSRTKTLHPPATPALSVGSFSPASSAGPITPPVAVAGLPGPTPYGLYGAPGSYNNAKYSSTYQQPPPQDWYHTQPVRVVRSNTSPPVMPSPHHSSNTSSSRSHSPSRSSRAQIHPYLEQGSRGPSIHWDMQDHPSAASRHKYTLSSSTLCEPATNPALSSLTVYPSSSLPISWAFTVVPSHGSSFVTVNDVLHAIYTHLRVNIKQKDYDGLRSHSEQREVTSAYEQRYRRHRSSEAYAQEKSGGMKRIDFLKRRTAFYGLEKTKRGDVWVLNTG